MSSKIPETTDKIKKKLSFSDVKPSYHRTAKPVSQQGGGILIDPHTEQVVHVEGMPQQQTSELAQQDTVLPAYHYNNMPSIHPTDELNPQLNPITTSQQNAVPAKQLTGEPSGSLDNKKKGTYYLTEKAAKQMDEMFIKSIASGKKKDKSVLICEAIELLYEKEYRNMVMPW